MNEKIFFQVFLLLGSSGGGDNKPAVSSYYSLRCGENALCTSKILDLLPSLSGSVGGDSSVFLKLLSKSWWLKLLESASSGNFPTL